MSFVSLLNKNVQSFVLEHSVFRSLESKLQSLESESNETNYDSNLTFSGNETRESKKIPA